MSDTSGAYHEPIERLSTDTMEMPRPLVSLREELDAVDWYRQRADACSDEPLRRILRHNLREEIEHACMLLEWLRRNDADFDENLTAYLFAKRKEIVEIEDPETETIAQRDPDDIRQAGTGDARAQSDSPLLPPRLTIGSLKEAR